MINTSKDFEFRPAKTEEMKDFFKLERYVFADNSTPSEDEEKENPLRPEMTTVAFHKGKMVATSAGLPFQMKFDGNTIRVDGVTSVGTDPAYRRQGLVRKLITSRLHESHEKQIAASILWASLGAIYQRFGYGLATTSQRYTFDPRLAGFQFDEKVQGQCIRMEKEDAMPILLELHEKYISDKNLHLHRLQAYWKHIYFGKKSKHHVVLHQNANGEPDGYCTYTLTEARGKIPGLDQTIDVREMVYMNRNAYRAMWEYIRTHDLVMEVKMWAPQDDPLLLMLLEPRSLRSQWNDGIWLRVIDVVQLAKSRTYARTGIVSFEIIEDRECPWNIGKYKIDFDGEQVEVNKMNGEVDFQIGINGLSTLLCGHSPLSLIANSGRACVLNSEKLSELDHFFTTRHKPYCPDNF